jgi:hypothetical protein
MFALPHQHVTRFEGGFLGYLGNLLQMPLAQLAKERNLTKMLDLARAP